MGKFPTPAGITHLEEASKEITATLAPIIDRLQEVMENAVKSAEIREVETQLEEFQNLADTFHGHIREVIARTQLAAKQDVNEDGEDEADVDHGRGRAKPDSARKT